MQTADVDLLDIDPFGLVEDEQPWESPTPEALHRSLEHQPGRHPQQSHAGDGVVGALDKLKLGKRVPAGFSVRSSRKLKTDYADVGVAEVDGPDGPQVRIGVIGNESGKWDAGFAGEARKAELRRQIAEKQALFDSDSDSDEVDDDIEDQISELERELEDLDGERTAIVSPEAMTDFQRQLGEALTVAKANKAEVDAAMKASDVIGEKRDAIIAEFGDAELERRISKASWKLRSAQKTVHDLENDLENGSRHGWDPEYTAERLASWKADAVEHEAELAPLLARRAQIMPPDARARLEYLDRQYAALNDADIDDMLTSAEVPAPNGARIRAEIWGSDDEDEQWVNAKLYVLGPAETTDDANSGDDYAYFRGLKGLNKLIAGLDTSGSDRSTESAVIPVSLASVALMSDSPAVQLMMYARSLEALGHVMRAGKRIEVNRGKGGKFAKKGVGDIAQAAAAAVDPDRRRLAFGRMDASFDADWRTTGAANSRTNAQRRYVSGEPAGDIAADLRGDADELDGRASRGDLLGAEVRDGRVGEREELALIARSDAKRLRRLADNLEQESGPRDATPEAPKAPSAPAATKPRRSAVAKALASGDPNALDGKGREALRREAKARGLEPRKGVSEDVLKDMLWDDENASKGAQSDGEDMPSAPEPAARGNPVDVLKSAQAGDGDKVRALLDGMSDAELRDAARELAREMGTVPVPKRGQSRQKLIDDIHDGTVGFRDRSKAIAGGRNLWQDESPERRAAALKKTASRRPSRPRTADDPVPYTPPTLDSTPKQNAIAIMRGRDVWAEMAAERGQPGAAPKPTPGAVGVDSTSAAARLQAIGSREDARQYLDDLRLTAPQMRQLAKALGAGTYGASRKDQLRNRIIEYTVGNRLNSQAIERGILGQASGGDAVPK